MAQPPPKKRSSDAVAAGILAPPQADDEIGRLGPYRVLQVLGRGGMGMVFKAEDPALRRTVALKIMLPELAKRKTAKERFLREAQAAANLEHDHIISIYQVGEDRGVPFIAMSFLKGMSLEDWLTQKRPLSMAQILRIGREVAKGLQAAHECGLIHRDIKPANLWLDAASKGRVKILDFGLARPEKEDTGLTRSGQIVGTPNYMSPEQAAGQKLDGRSDLFSLGVLLYRLSTGVLPFRGDNVMAVLTALATQNPQPALDLNPEMPPALDRLITQLLAKDRDARPKSAREVVEALAAIDRDRAMPRVSADPTLLVNGGEADAASQAFNFQETQDSFLNDDDLNAGARNKDKPPVPAPRRLKWPVILGSCVVLAGLIAGAAIVFWPVSPVTPGVTAPVRDDAIGTVELATDGVQDKVQLEHDGKVVATIQPGQRQARLKPGRYTARPVQSGVLRVDRPDFDLKKDERIALRLSRPAAVTPPPDPPKPPVITTPKEIFEIPPELLAAAAWGRFAPGTWVKRRVRLGNLPEGELTETLKENSPGNLIVEKQLRNLGQPQLVNMSAPDHIVGLDEPAATLKAQKRRLRMLPDETLMIAGRAVRTKVVEIRFELFGNPLSAATIWYSRDVPGAVCRIINGFEGLRVHAELIEFAATRPSSDRK